MNTSFSVANHREVERCIFVLASKGSRSPWAGYKLKLF